MESASKRRNKSKNYCCVPHCNSYYSGNLSFHKFPKDNLLKNEWGRVLKIGKSITNHMQVCSKHFRKEDYFFNRSLTSKTHFLKRGAIPSCSLPRPPSRRNECLAEIRANRKKNRQHLRDHSRQVEETATENDMEVADILLTFSRNDKNTHSDHTYHSNPSETIEHKLCEDKEIQVNIFDDFINENVMSEIITTDYTLRILTGIYNFALLNILIKGISKFDLRSTCKLSIKNRIILTMMRLKLDIPFAALAVFFNVLASTAKSTFESTVNSLALLLKPTIRFPCKAEIQKNIPQCFEQYSDTRIVLDCIEIAIQKSKCSNYPNYKGRHTIKFLIGTAPLGLITYVSKPYEGRVSDKAIFNKENLIFKLDSGDAVMVDKGFLIEKECESNNIKLIRPPFFRKKKQLTESEAVETANIALARVHVERVIERIKLFRIFKNVLPLKMLPFANNVLTIVVAVTNLSKPTLTEDKFM